MKLTTLSTELKYLDGEPIKDQKGKAMTVKSVASDALLSHFQDENNLSGDEKLKRFKLAQKIYESNGEIELKAEDVALIKKLIAKAFPPLVTGQAYELIEPSE